MEFLKEHRDDCGCQQGQRHRRITGSMTRSAKLYIEAIRAFLGDS
jgi:hypothetical protein